MRITCILVGAIFASLAGCERFAELHDSFEKSQYRQPFHEKLRVEISAPYIVLGRVLEVTEIGRPRISQGDDRVKTQETKLRIEIEQAIKGKIESSYLEFVYFAFSRESHSDLGVPHYLADVGQRRIFFLKPILNSYRSIGDVTDYTLRMSSGKHPPDFCLGKQPGCCIAEMLLTPGEENFINEDFVQGLFSSEYVSEEFCSRGMTLKLLALLIKNPDPKISAGADEVTKAVVYGWEAEKQKAQSPNPKWQ